MVTEALKNIDTELKVGERYVYESSIGSDRGDFPVVGSYNGMGSGRFAKFIDDCFEVDLEEVAEGEMVLRPASSFDERLAAFLKLNPEIVRSSLRLSRRVLIDRGERRDLDDMSEFETDFFEKVLSILR